MAIVLADGIALEDKPTVMVNPPEDPALATLWGLALAKTEAATGRSPAVRADMKAVVDEYQRLMAKARGSIADIIRERCEKAPGGD